MFICQYIIIGCTNTITQKKTNRMCCHNKYENQKWKKKNRCQWIKNWKLEKVKFGNIPLLNEIRENNPDDFRNYLRMDSLAFDILLNLVRLGLLILSFHLYSPYFLFSKDKDTLYKILKTTVNSLDQYLVSWVIVYVFINVLNYKKYKK